MKKIEDGTYRAIRCDASGYVYGNYRTGIDAPNSPEGHYIKERGQDNWIVPIKEDTLMYRKNGKWLYFFPEL
jgi:hypothetical protein